MSTIIDTAKNISLSDVQELLCNSQIGAAATIAPEHDSSLNNKECVDCVSFSEQAIPRHENKFHRFERGGYVEGHCEPKYRPVVDALKENLSLGRDKGCQLVIMVDNHVVVDLVSRSPSEKEEYNADTVQNVFRYIYCYTHIKT
jgi:hypothetical protein